RRPRRAAGIEVVEAGPEQPYPTARDVDLDALALAELAQPHPGPALRHCELHHFRVEFGDLDIGIAGEVDGVGADAQLGAGFRVGPKGAAGRDREIDFRRRPGRLALGVEGKRALDEADPADAGGWFLLGG